MLQLHKSAQYVVKNKTDKMLLVKMQHVSVQEEFLVRGERSAELQHSSPGAAGLPACCSRAPQQANDC